MAKLRLQQLDTKQRKNLPPRLLITTRNATKVLWTHETMTRVTRTMTRVTRTLTRVTRSLTHYIYKPNGYAKLNYTTRMKPQPKIVENTLPTKNIIYNLHYSIVPQYNTSTSRSSLQLRKGQGETSTPYPKLL